MISKEIIFTSPLGDIIDCPAPALFNIPKEYKNLPQRLEGSGLTDRTVKACMPFLDAYTIGYIIPAPIDFAIEVKKYDYDIKFKMTVSRNFPEKFKEYFSLAQHAKAQIPEELRFSHRTIDSILKFIMPWTIKTPSGYSCIVTNPLNRNLPFKIIDGVVDTDEYDLPINLPFYWTNNVDQEETIIKKGTPLAQVIPFKRENWKMKVIQEEILSDKKSLKLATYLNGAYKKIFWKKKSYK